MNDDLASRLQDLPPDLADRPDRFESVRGRVVRRRRRRAVVGSALAAAVVVAGVSVAAASNDPGQGRSVEAADRSEAPTSVPDPGSPELSVVVINARDFDRGDLPDGSAVWDAGSQTLVYFSPRSYPACLTEGLASTDGGTVDLALAIQPEGCGESLNFAVIEIRGLAEAPRELRVTEDDRTTTMPVDPGQGGQAQELGVAVDRARTDDDRQPPAGTARWDAGNETITYVPRSAYNACLAGGTAREVGASVSLDLVSVTKDECLLVLSAAVVTIRGLTEAPTELSVTEDGRTTTVPVEQGEDTDEISQQEIDRAVEAARTQVADTGATLSAATVVQDTGVVGSSNTGQSCDSGRLLRVELFGTFPEAAVGGPPGATDTEVTAMSLTVDAESGSTCLVSVGTGDGVPDPAATRLPVGDIAD